MPWALASDLGRRRAQCRSVCPQDATSGIDAASTPATIAHLVVQGDATQLDAARCLPPQMRR